MPTTPNSRTGSGQVEVYQIRIKGHLGPLSGDWFDRMITTAEANGDTLLTGPIVDQAELHGLLRKLQDLGIPLISFMRLDATNDEVVDERTDREERRETEAGS
jgi:hypothetical protein